MTTIINNLAIAGYRSFGKEPQYFDRFAKVNIFIGQNNAGKSNVLRFLTEIYANASKLRTSGLDELAHHLPDRPQMLLGLGYELPDPETGISTLPTDHVFLGGLTGEQRSLFARCYGQLFAKKAKLDGTSLCWSLLTIPDCVDNQDSWRTAIKTLDDHTLFQIWASLTNQSGGGRMEHWEPRVIQNAKATVSYVNSVLIPAIRRIGDKGSTSEAFDGTGIIERLAKLQNPDVLNQEKRLRFTAIQDFLCDVVNRADARIEIPYERDTILVHMDGKVLPVESLGSGIHEVLILAAAATVLSGHVVCVEEPELHLNPILQKKLIRYLVNNTDNQYFITTHSAALMDTPEAEIYHIRLKSGSSVAERVTSDSHRSGICEDLGYHPSDLLQSNCVIWVEGPSDRIYVNWWLSALASPYVEGIHYSIMFYGGRLASHLSNAADADEVGDFISLRHLNRRSVMILDSDKDQPSKRLNATKVRLKSEFDSGPGHAWITDGREIENYLEPSQVNDALAAIHPSYSKAGGVDKYEQMLALKSSSQAAVSASKVEIARYICEHFKPQLDVYDLKKQLLRLHKFVAESNPSADV